MEVFHKSLKSNAHLAKSPTRTVRTQSNPVFMAIVAAFKLEGLKPSPTSSIPSRFVANYSSTPLDPPMNSFSCSERLRNISEEDSP